MLNDIPELVGKRFCYEGEYGTILYHGTIDGKPGNWFGIEWDRVERGKHSGSLGDNQYFKTRIANAGSFLNDRQKLDFGKTFLEALVEKYLSKAHSGIVKSSSITKEVEMIGWEKVQGKISKLDHLREIGLSGTDIWGETRLDDITQTCPNAVDIDLSRNLFSSLEQIAEICKRMPSLEIVRLGRNRFVIPAVPLPNAFDNVAVLTLNATMIEWSSIQQLDKWFPVLKELHLGSNQISKLSPIEGFPNLELLNLEENSLTNWDDLLHLRKLTTLKTLILADNQIDCIKPNLPLEGLEYLNIARNLVSSWMCIHALNSFPKLTNIRLNGNPICRQVSESQRRITMIARLKNILKFEGSILKPRDRLDAECYYLQHCLEDIDSPDFEQKHPRYKELCEQYGEPVKGKKDDTVADRLIELVLYNPQGNIKVSKKVPKTMTIRAFKTIMARALNGKTWQQSLRRSVVWADCQTGEYRLEEETKDLEFYGLTDGSTLKFA